MELRGESLPEPALAGPVARGREMRIERAPVPEADAAERAAGFFHSGLLYPRPTLRSLFIGSWWRGRDSNPRAPCGATSFQVLSALTALERTRPDSRFKNRVTAAVLTSLTRFPVSSSSVAGGTGTCHGRVTGTRRSDTKLAHAHATRCTRTSSAAHWRSPAFDRRRVESITHHSNIIRGDDRLPWLEQALPVARHGKSTSPFSPRGDES
jgi:hypothetical protein